jgi:hypothetical protein
MMCRTDGANFAFAVAGTPLASACLGVTLPAELATVEATIEAAAMIATVNCRIAICFFLLGAVAIPRSVPARQTVRASVKRTNA